MIIWALTILAVLGAILVSTGRPASAYLGHCIWIVTNLGLIFHNYARGDMAQAAMFAVYLFLAARGVWKWR